MLNARRSTRSRVDHFGRGLQVVAAAATADRCNSSATSRVVQHRWRWRTATTAGISTPSLPLYLCDSSTFSSYLTTVSSSFLSLFPFSFSSVFWSSFLVRYTVRNTHKLTVPPLSLHPSRYHPTLSPFLSSTVSLRLFPALQDPRNDVLRTY